MMLNTEEYRLIAQHHRYATRTLAIDMKDNYNAAVFVIMRRVRKKEKRCKSQHASIQNSDKYDRRDDKVANHHDIEYIKRIMAFSQKNWL